MKLCADCIRHLLWQAVLRDDTPPALLAGVSLISIKVALESDSGGSDDRKQSLRLSMNFPSSHRQNRRAQ